VSREHATRLALIERIPREPAPTAARSAPIWRREADGLFFSDAGPRLRRSLDDNVELISQYLAGQLVGLALQAALLVVALVVLGRARHRVAPGSHERPIADVFEVRNSAALVLVLVTTPWLYAHPPRAVMNSVALLILVPVMLIVRKLAPRELRPAVYALASCFVVDRVRDLCADLPRLERSVFLVEMILGIVCVALALRSESIMAAARPHEASRARRASERILWVAMGVLAFAVVAGAVGYMRLARALGTSVLVSGYAALILYAAVRIADGLWAYLLHARPSSSLRMVQEHRERLQRRLGSRRDRGAAQLPPTRAGRDRRFGSCTFRCVSAHRRCEAAPARTLDSGANFAACRRGPRFTAQGCICDRRRRSGAVLAEPFHVRNLRCRGSWPHTGR
jgi:hypothetical protein